MTDDKKLIPLTDPSVRGVLVKCSRSDPDGGILFGTLGVDGPHKLRPASDFGVAGGEPGLKKLPEGWQIIKPTERGEREAIHYFIGDIGWWSVVDPALYAIPDGGEREDAETVEYWSGIVTDKNQRIKELESELAKEQSQNKSLFSIGIYHQEQHCRLRKAIEEAGRELCPMGIAIPGAGKAADILQAALSPSPAAASGEKLEPSMLPVSSTSKVVSRDSDYRRPTSAPAAENQGNARHHTEGAKIPEGGSGSPAAESEGVERSAFETFDRELPENLQRLNPTRALLDEANAKMRQAVAEREAKDVKRKAERDAARAAGADR